MPQVRAATVAAAAWLGNGAPVSFANVSSKVRRAVGSVVTM